MSETDDQNTVPPFEPLATVILPVLPSEEFFRLLKARMLALLRKANDTPFIADDRLHTATLDILDDVVAPPACGPVLDELQATLEPWLADPSPAFRTKLIVLPPCDANDIVGTWAAEHGHQVLEVPSREALLTGAPDDHLPDRSGKGLLVVPQLERWFLRHRSGLSTVRALLARIEELDRPCVVGCNSWAWEFLKKAVGAHMLLPGPLTYRPFDGRRLHAWIGGLAANELTQKIKFRLPATGTDVLAVDTEGRRSGDYFDTLAAQSRGIPWVAWHLWRRSLRSDGEEGSEHGEAVRQEADEQTLWVAALDEFTLPNQGDETALLVLHALLIHGALTTDELRSVLPIVGGSPVVSALVTAGFVERDGAYVTCRPAAYPAIRDGLSAAGFSMDGL